MTILHQNEPSQESENSLRLKFDKLSSSVYADDIHSHCPFGTSRSLLAKQPDSVLGEVFRMSHCLHRESLKARELVSAREFVSCDVRGMCAYVLAMMRSLFLMTRLSWDRPK